MSIKTKIAMTFLITCVVFAAVVSLMLILRSLSQIEHQLGNQAKAVAESLSLQINGDEHQDILENIADRENMPESLQLNSFLTKAKKILGLKTELYTVAHAFWLENQMVFVGSSEESTNTIRGMNEPEYVSESLRSGKSGATEVFTNMNGEWITGFAPIRGKNGNIVGLIEVALSVEEVVNGAKFDFLKTIAIYGIISLLVLIFVGIWLAKSISSPIESLTEDVKRRLQSNDILETGIRSSDEVLNLSFAFDLLFKKVSRQIFDLNNLNSGLHETVEERTAEIVSLARFPDENPNPVFRLDRDRKVIYSNEAAQEIFGLLGVQESTLTNKTVVSMFEETVDNGKSEFELTLNTRTFHIVIRNIAKEGYSNFYFQDITQKISAEIQRKNLESQLIQANKMTSIGVLAAGVAHELNNPLTVIKGFTEFELKKNPTATSLQKILRNTNRMATIINHLRIFSRDSRNEKMSRCSLREIINLSLSVLNKQLETDNIRCDINVPEILNVHGSSNQLESVFINLISNSKDAFESKITGEKKIEMHAEQQQDGRVSFIYRDNAGGMPKKIMDSIFEPFVTTKEPGKGTGLGMSIVHGIIQSHEASISVCLTEDKGTEFRILFPDASKFLAEIEVSDSAKNSSVANFRDKLKILVVDDEEDVCQVLQARLDSHFQVDFFCDPEVIRNLEDFCRFDAIITDMRMPQITGVELVEKVRALGYSIPIIIVSGDADLGSIIKSTESLDVLVMSKPIDFEKLIYNIQRLVSVHQNTLKVSA